MSAASPTLVESNAVEAGSSRKRRARGETARELPTLALTKAEAARSLGISVESFDRYVLPEVRVVRRGRLLLVDVRELERWLERSSARTLGDS